MTELATRSTSDARLRDLVARVQRKAIRTISAAYTATGGDDVILVNTTGGSVTVTLPPAGTHYGHTYYVKKLVAANTVTIDGNASETIDGATTVALTTQWGTVTLVSNGVAWFTL